MCSITSSKIEKSRKLSTLFSEAYEPPYPSRLTCVARIYLTIKQINIYRFSELQNIFEAFDKKRFIALSASGKTATRAGLPSGDLLHFDEAVHGPFEANSSSIFDISIRF